MILAEHELCECLVVDADQEAFNSHLNKEQIIKARVPAAARACRSARAAAHMGARVSHRPADS